MSFGFGVRMTSFLRETVSFQSRLKYQHTHAHCFQEYLRKFMSSSIADRLQFHRIWLLMGWALVLFVVFESLTPDPLAIPDAMGIGGDKFGHAAAYATLMLWFAQLYSSPDRRYKLAGAFVALGMGMEFAQLLTQVRSFEILDMISSGAGVAFGFLIAPPRTVNILHWLESVFAHK